MRYRFIAAGLAFASLVALSNAAAAQDQSVATPAQPTPMTAASHQEEKVKGLYLITEYPSVTIRPGSTETISFKLKNYGMPPELMKLSVTGVPTGWTATILGGGRPVAAAMPATDDDASLQLRLDIPKDATTTGNLTVTADGNNTTASLPLSVSLAKDLPAKLSLTPELPELRGNAKSSFDYKLTIKNDSGKKLLVSLAADAPPNFETSFTESYGSQELNVVPIEAGASKDMKLKVQPPSTVDAGKYEVTARVAAEDATATAKVGLDITGQPNLQIAGREGVLSARASAGTETSIPIVIGNTGTAPADDVALSGSAPSGWKVTFDPKNIDRIAPGEVKEVQALLTPTSKAIAGDYVTTIRASARGESASQNFRISVSTSTLWGIIGVAVIGIALLVMVGAVARFGRR